MSDLISRQETLSILANLNSAWVGYEKVSRLPTIDAVPVVRCEDCRFYRFYDGTFGKGWMCFENNTARHGDDYCSRGIRKDDA